jgi:hypothetical protein
MKKVFVVVISACLIISCSKSGGSNVLVGTWSQSQIVKRFKNPYSLVVDYDTLWGGGTTVEFRKDGGYYVNGSLMDSYTLDKGSVFTLTPPGQVPVHCHFTISGTQMTTWRDGFSGEQIKVFYPGQTGEFQMANVEMVFSEFIKQ